MRGRYKRSMADPAEREAFTTLTLLVAVCEQGVDRLRRLDPPADGELIDALERARDLAMVELQFGRFLGAANADDDDRI